MLATEKSQPADEEAIEEAAAALAALDAELGRTTDPVRMYMREMGTVELLTREGEISIAKRIEEGLDAVRRALANYPATIEHLLNAYETVKSGQGRLVDIIVGFIDPNAPDVIAQPQNPTKMEVVEAAADEKEDEPKKATTARPKRPSTPARIRKKPRAASRSCASCTPPRCANIAEDRHGRSEDASRPAPRPPPSSWSSSSRRACSRR